MTKKILALALAGTTAFSVFAGALSVNAGWNSDKTVYTWDAGVSDAPDAFENLAENASPELAAGVFTSVDEVKKISFDKPTDDGFEYAATAYYAADWKVNTADGASKTADFKTKVEAITDDVTAVNSVIDAYTINGTSNGFILKGSEDKDWTAAWAKLISNYGDVKGYIVDGNVSEVKVAADYDVEDFDDYDAEKLFAAITTVATSGGSGTTTLSYLTYLNTEYTRIMGEVGEADTSSKQDKYYSMLERIEAMNADDYTAYNWRDIETCVANAEDKANEGKWDDAISYLQTALDKKPEKADSTALRDTLLSLYDNNGKTTTSYIAETYPTDGTDYAVYDGDDYLKSNGDPSDEWKLAFGTLTGEDRIEFDLNRDGVAEPWTSVYALAYKTYSDVRKGVRVGQSAVDYANELLTSAIEALDPTTSGSSWKLMELEATIELAESFVDSDFNTNSKYYKTFATALERAQNVLAKSSPAKNEVSTAITSLSGAITNLRSVSKAIPSASSKELREANKNAKKLYDDFINDKVTGAQVIALKNALDTYEDRTYFTPFNIDGGNAKELISDVEAMIEEFNTAINGFNQAQGWYTTAEGKWMYGEGDGYYVDGWKQIGNFWFFFNADGTAKQNEWFQDGSNWYYCGNSCVAYSGWGKVDGSWYYFSKANVMCTGWIRPSNSYYYLDPTSGKMVTGWAQIGGKWYYFSTDSNNLGAMLTSTTTPDGYQVGADGAMI